MYCNACESNPCSCRKTASAQSGDYWIIQQCATEGCRSTIRVPSGSQLANPVCKWCAGHEGQV